MVFPGEKAAGEEAAEARREVVAWVGPEAAMVAQVARAGSRPG